jgi:hypothetical protein
LSPRTRGLIVIGGTVEASLKIAVLVDLARRPTSQVKGSRLQWAAAIVLINSFGALPLAYIVLGRSPGEAGG